MTQPLEPMQVLDESCPFHKDELTRLVEIGGIPLWLISQGWIDTNHDPTENAEGIKLRIWERGVTEIAEMEYRCRFGCRLFAFALVGGDWAANGEEVRVNDLMDFFPHPDHPPPTKEEWEAGLVRQPCSNDLVLPPSPNSPKFEPCKDETHGTDWYRMPDGACSCGIHKHHYHCDKCGGYTQIG